MPYFVTANIGRGVDSSKARRNILKVRQAFHTLPVVAFQEIDEADQPDEHALLHAAFPDDMFHWIGKGRREPIAVPDKWERMDSPVPEYVQASKGVPRKTPARGPVSGLVNFGPRDRPVPVAVVNAHFPNFDPVSRLWQDNLDTLREVVKGYTQHGYPVVWMGDTNANRPANMPKVHHKERRQVAAGNDYIGFIPGRLADIDVLGTGKIDLTIDGHNAHWLRLRVHH